MNKKEKGVTWDPANIRAPKGLSVIYEILFIP